MKPFFIRQQRVGSLVQQNPDYAARIPAGEVARGEHESCGGFQGFISRSIVLPNSSCPLGKIERRVTRNHAAMRCAFQRPHCCVGSDILSTAGRR